MLHNASRRGALGLVQFGHNGVRRVGHDGAEDSSNVTSSEGDHKLLALGALNSGLRNDVPKEKRQGVYTV